jgi:alpha-galactosidase
VEVPVWVSLKGFEPVHVGALPPQCAVLTNQTAQIEEMAVEGALTGNSRLIYHAIANDPLTSAVLSLAEIAQMVNQMFEQNKAFLPYFKTLSV